MDLRLPTAATEAPRAAVHSAAETALPLGVLDGGEIVLLAIKPSVWRTLFDAGPWLLVTCLLAGVLAWKRLPMLGLSPTATAQMLLMIGVARFAVAVVRWIPTWYVLTNRRVLRIHGVRTPAVTATLLTDLRQAHMTVSAPERFAGIGTLTLISRREDQEPHRWESIHSPQVVLDKIRDAANKAAHLHDMVP